MKVTSTCFLTILMLIGINLPVEAQNNSYSVSCGRNPRNLTLFKEGLKTQVFDLVDLLRYKNVRVSVSLKKLTDDRRVFNLDERPFFTGLNILNQDTPDGLAFSAQGEAVFNTDFDQFCTYEYIAEITTSGTEIATNKRVTSRTVSKINIKTRMEGRLKRTRTGN